MNDAREPCSKWLDSKYQPEDYTSIFCFYPGCSFFLSASILLKRLMVPHALQWTFLLCNITEFTNKYTLGKFCQRTRSCNTFDFKVWKCIQSLPGPLILRKKIEDFTGYLVLPVQIASISCSHFRNIKVHVLKYRRSILKWMNNEENKRWLSTAKLAFQKRVYINSSYCTFMTVYGCGRKKISFYLHCFAHSLCWGFFTLLDITWHSIFIVYCDIKKKKKKISYLAALGYV